MNHLYVFAVTAYVLSGIAAASCTYGVSGLKRSGWISRGSISDWLGVLGSVACVYGALVAAAQLPFAIASLAVVLGLVSGLVWLRYRLRMLRKRLSFPRRGPAGV